MGFEEDGPKTRVVASSIGLALLASILLSFLFQGTAVAHAGDYLISPVATTEVVVDGNITAVEWSEAPSVDLGAIPGNILSASLRVKHNDSFLFVAFDVTGDTSLGDRDTSVIGFDTGHDAIATVGHEDLFYQGGLIEGGQAHLIFDGVAWTLHDAPYDESLPNHTGLTSVSGFGPSDMTLEDHRSYEFRIPLVLLGAGPGDVVGFVAAVIDYDTGVMSFWPQPIFVLEMDDFGDLLLDTPAQPVDVRLLPPSQTKNALPGDTVAYRLEVVNRGTAGDDTFDFTASSAWPVSFWNATGTEPLADTDGDGIPDTGIIASGSSASIVVKVDVLVDASGRNEAAVTANSTADPGISSTALLITKAQPARFNPPHFDFGNDTDVPPDGLFNYLVVWANVTVAEPGGYSVQGIVFDQNGTFPISFASVSASLAPGDETLGLLFSGQEIFASGIDGPYSVLLLLYDGNFTLVDEGNHTTRAYAYTEFQKPPAYFAPPHSDFGLDTDGDFLFNYLVVEASIQVDEAGMYYVDGFLHDPSYTLTLWTSNVTTLDVGLQTVPLWFDGIRINASGVDGPYTVELTLYDTFAFLDSDTHETAAYSHLEFQSPPAAFSPPHSDFGLDTDGDFLFNYLVVDVNLTVTEAGTYRIDGALYGSHIGFASNVTTLDVGAQTVPLWFDGVRINASRIDGPYTVELRLYDDTFRFLDSETHTTANYSHLDFEEPPARFSPPHFDFGLDTDGDVLFNFLAVNVSLQVDVAGMYLVDGILHDGNFTFGIFTSNVTNLEVGNQSVHLFFQGTRINTSEVDGPYTVDLNLYDYSTFTFLDEDSHNTTAYSHLDFNGPPARFAPLHSDSGLDTDGDGLFNYLVVDTSIQADRAGMYRVEGVLRDPTYRLRIYTSNVTTLDVGLQTVPLWFDGEAIRVSGVDGPYTVDLTLYDYESFTFLDSDTHETARYSHLDFNEPVPTFRVGTILPLTGILEFLGRPMRDAADLAAADINTAGGVLGIMLELLHRDSQTDPFAGSDAARDLVFGEGVPAIIGAAASGVSLPVAEITIPNEVVQISPSSTSPAFTTLEPEEPGWFWRTAASDALEGKVAAMRSIERGWTRVGILAADNPWPLWEADAFRENFAREGRSVVVQVNYTEGQGDYTSDLQLIADAAPDAVFFMGFPGDGLTILQNWEANKAQPGWDWDWLFWQGLKSTDFMSNLRVAGIDITGVEGTAPIFTGPNYEAFRTEYLNQYGREPEIFAAHTYDALYLMALAAVAGQAGDSLTIRDNLIRVASPPGTVVGPGPGEFERAVGILEAGGEIDYEGASSRVNFDQVGDVGSSFEVWQITQDYEILQIDLIPESQIWLPSDTTSPTVTLSSPLAGAILPTGDVLVSWSANDFESGIDRIEVSLDDGMPVVLVAIETTHTFTGVGDGSHTITATAFDVAGNSQIASVGFTVDTTPPTTSITSPSSGAFVAASSVQVLWTASDITSGIDSFEVSLDDETPVVLPATATSYTFPGVADGSHTVTVVAFDAADNSLAASADFTVDTVAPTVSLLSPSAAVILTSSNVDVTWTASDVTSGLDHFEVSLDGGTPVELLPTATAHTFSGVGDGAHSITVTAIDAAGNSIDASVEFTVDTNPFSPTGPYGSGPLIGTIAAVIATVLVLLVMLTRRRGSQPKMPRTRGPPKKGEEPPPPDDVTGQIRELKRLRDEGLVTEEEFRAKEEELLSRR